MNRPASDTGPTRRMPRACAIVAPAEPRRREAQSDVRTSTHAAFEEALIVDLRAHAGIAKRLGPLAGKPVRIPYDDRRPDGCAAAGDRHPEPGRSIATSSPPARAAPRPISAWYAKLLVKQPTVTLTRPAARRSRHVPRSPRARSATDSGPATWPSTRSRRVPEEDRSGDPDDRARPARLAGGPRASCVSGRETR